MPRVRLARLAVACCLLAASACKRDEPTPEPTPQTTASPAPTDPPAEPGPEGRYARSLAAQLDLIPPDADGYLVIRDLRPLLDQARIIERVMAGPLARAIPALAELGGGTGQARLEQLEQARALLELLLAGSEAAGITLDRGLVVAFGQGAPMIVFAAESLDRLSMLAGLAGDSVDLSKRCGELTDNPGYFVCSLGDAAAIGSYAPAKQGEALAKRLADRLGAKDLATLEPINVALSLAGSSVAGTQSIDVALRTDPDLWELSMPVPLPPGSGDRLLNTGPSTALRAWVPGTSFAWARVNPTAILEGDAAILDPKLATGELYFGAVDQPDGLVLQAGINDTAATRAAIQALADALPEDAIEPEELGGMRLELDRASIQLGGERVPSLGMTATGDDANGWSASLGVEPRARLWAGREYLGFALGEVQAIPAALERITGDGASAQTLASLPTTITAALAAKQVALLVHLSLDHWQAPPSEAELAALLDGLPADSRPSPTAILAVTQALSPWSSVSLWLSRGDAKQPYLAHLSIVPFVGEAPGVEQAELTAAKTQLDAVLAGADGVTGYRELATRFPNSPRLDSYRARAGDAPEHHAAASMVVVGVVAAVVVPIVSEYLAKAERAPSEAPAQTQSMLSSALQVYEQRGCKALRGEVGPTPPLDVICSDGAGGRCHAGDAASTGAGRYPSTLWDAPLWQTLGVRLDSPAGHRFHYTFASKHRSDGGCELTVRAQSDADAHGKRETYERTASIAADGTQSLAPMRITDE